MQIEAELILKVGRKELRLSPEEARELRDALVELVGPRQPVYWVNPPYVYPCVTYTPTENNIWSINATGSTTCLTSGQDTTADIVTCAVAAH